MPCATRFHDSSIAHLVTQPYPGSGRAWRLAARLRRNGSPASHLRPPGITPVTREPTSTCCFSQASPFRTRRPDGRIPTEAVPDLRRTGQRPAAGRRARPPPSTADLHARRRAPPICTRRRASPSTPAAEHRRSAPAPDRVPWLGIPCYQAYREALTVRRRPGRRYPSASPHRARPAASTARTVSASTSRALTSPLASSSSRPRGSRAGAAARQSRQAAATDSR